MAASTVVSPFPSYLVTQLQHHKDPPVMLRIEALLDAATSGRSTGQWRQRSSDQLGTCTATSIAIRQRQFISVGAAASSFESAATSGRVGQPAASVPASEPAVAVVAAATAAVAATATATEVASRATAWGSAPPKLASATREQATARKLLRLMSPDARRPRVHARRSRTLWWICRGSSQSFA